jgi:2-keto-4-pentenoate hydratase/2-oxohepta-3-ene-1,7-dioic acid hydratase in catechol pathway
MRIARVATEAGARVALVEGDTLRLLTSPTDVLDLLRDPTVAEATDETVPLASARLLPPLAPPSVRDFLTFEQHVEGMIRLHDPPRNVHPRWYEAPTFYFSNPHALVGAHDDIAIPPGCEVFDYELEVAAVIGRDGRDLSPEAARDHIVGYTIFNDWSARDLQFEEMQAASAPRRARTRRSRSAPVS